MNEPWYLKQCKADPKMHDKPKQYHATTSVAASNSTSQKTNQTCLTWPSFSPKQTQTTWYLSVRLSQVKASISLQNPLVLTYKRMWPGSGESWEFCFQSLLGHNGPVCLHSTLCQTGYAIAISTSALKQLEFCRFCNLHRILRKCMTIIPDVQCWMSYGSLFYAILTRLTSAQGWWMTYAYTCSSKIVMKNYKVLWLKHHTLSISDVSIESINKTGQITLAIWGDRLANYTFSNISAIIHVLDMHTLISFFLPVKHNCRP